MPISYSYKVVTLGQIPWPNVAHFKITEDFFKKCAVGWLLDIVGWAQHIPVPQRKN